MPRVNQGPYTVMITRPNSRFRGRNTGQTVTMTREAAYAMVARRDGYIVSGPGLDMQHGRRPMTGPRANRAMTIPTKRKAPAPAPVAAEPEPTIEEFVALPYKEQQAVCKALGLVSQGKAAMADAYEDQLND